MIKIPPIIVCDFGGVIAKTDTTIVAHSIAPLFSIPYEDALALITEQKKAKHRGIGPEQFWNDVAKRLHITLPDNWLLSYEDIKCLAVRENKKMSDVIRYLKRQGHRLALFSNVTPHRASFIRKSGLYDPFDPVVLSCDIHLKKPALEAFAVLFERLKAPPSDCLFIDDKEENIAAAKACGMNALLFSTAEKLIEELHLSINGINNPRQP